MVLARVFLGAPAKASTGPGNSPYVFLEVWAAVLYVVHDGIKMVYKVSNETPILGHHRKSLVVLLRGPYQSSHILDMLP